MNKKEKAFIIFRRFVLASMNIGRVWVIGMGLVLLTYLYVDSSLPHNWLFSLLWLAGCIEIAFRELIENDAPGRKNE